MSVQPINPQKRGIRGPIFTMDGSLAQTGWALTAETGLLIQSGVFRSKAGEGWPSDHRIYAIAQEMVAIRRKLRREPKHFGVEHQFFRPSAPGAAFKLQPEVVAALARLEGVLIFVAKNWDPGIDILQLRSTEWRGLLGVTPGKDLKARGIVEVRRRLALNGTPTAAMAEDQLEAIGLSFALHHELTHGYPLAHRRAELKTEKKARRERAKLPPVRCAVCTRPIRNVGAAVPYGMHGECLVHVSCRPRKKRAAKASDGFPLVLPGDSR